MDGLPDSIRAFKLEDDAQTEIVKGRLVRSRTAFLEATKALKTGDKRLAMERAYTCLRLAARIYRRMAMSSRIFNEDASNVIANALCMARLIGHEASESLRWPPSQIGYCCGALSGASLDLARCIEAVRVDASAPSEFVGPRMCGDDVEYLRMVFIYKLVQFELDCYRNEVVPSLCAYCSRETFGITTLKGAREDK